METRTTEISRQVSLLLSSAMVLSSWSPSKASENQTKPQSPTVPMHEVPEGGWPEPPKAPTGAPNVVVILIDDVGFGATSAFGGPINTPNLQRLANAGLRYNSFHINTLCCRRAPRCSPVAITIRLALVPLPSGLRLILATIPCCPRARPPSQRCSRRTAIRHTSAANGTTRRYGSESRRSLRPLAHRPRLRKLLWLQSGGG